MIGLHSAFPKREPARASFGSNVHALVSLATLLVETCVKGEKLLLAASALYTLQLLFSSKPGRQDSRDTIEKGITIRMQDSRRTLLNMWLGMLMISQNKGVN
jgi:hypothetical protein